MQERVSPLGPRSHAELDVQYVAVGDAVSPTRCFHSGRLWWSEFLAPPGRYTVAADNGEFVCDLLEVTAGGYQEITVAIRPR